MHHAEIQLVTIIAAIDLTEISLDLAQLAVRVAQRLGDRLLLLHAAEPTGSTYGGVVPAAVDAAPRADAAAGMLGKLRDDVHGAGTKGVEIEARVVIGPPDRAVAEVARETGARLIVAGTHGRGPIGRLLMGSVAQRLLLRAPCAVLVIRPGAGAALEGWLGGGRRLQVVVGIDRRGRATDAALDWARQLGDLGPCDLTLVHEYWPPAEYRRLGMRGPRDLFETDPEVAGILQRELEAKVGTLAWAPNATLRVRAAWGPIGEALAREAEAVRADLIVVGSEQPHGWRRVRRGSIAVSALHAAPVLLLSVPERTGTTVTGEAPLVAPPLRSILAATDLSEPGNAAVAHAFSLLRAEGGVVHLCHVCEHALPSPPYAYAPAGEGLSGAHRSAVEAGLQALVPPEAAEIGIEARVVVVDGGDPATEVVAAAARLGADAIVIASHGRSGVKRAVLGSAAEAVLRASEIPVYVVPRRRGDGP